MMLGVLGIDFSSDSVAVRNKWTKVGFLILVMKLNVRLNFPVRPLHLASAYLLLCRDN